MRGGAALLAVRLALAVGIAQDPGADPSTLAPATVAGGAEPAAEDARDAGVASTAAALAGSAGVSTEVDDELAGAESSTVTTRLTPEGDKHVGDLLVLEVTVAHAKGVSVNLPMGLDFTPLELVAAETLGTEPTGADLRTSFRLTLQYFDLGEATIPSFRLTSVDATGAVAALEVPATRFEITALTANEAEPERRGEDPPISLEYPNETLEMAIYLALAGLVVIAAVFVLARLYLRRRRPAFVAPPRPAHELALAALRELERTRDERIQTGQLQDYYLELTEIAKAYLQGRFRIDALDRTTDEIRAELLAAERGGDRLGSLDARAVIRFLQECDLVKFARFAPPADEARDALEQVRTMVRTTMPASEASASQAGARA